MKAAVIEREGSVPAVTDVDDPMRNSGQALIEVTAAPINPVDLSLAAGRFTVPAAYPYVAGKEGVGRVVEADALPAGRRVYFATGGGHGPGGSLAERTVAPESECVELPEGVDDAHAACYGIAGLAAWLALDWRGGLKEGETVLVLGASGAVGMIAVQAARLLGAGRLIAAARSPEGLERALELGADAGVSLARHDAADRLREAAGEHGIDLTVDPLWGEPAEAAVTASAYGGRLVQIGRSAGETATLASAAVRGKQLSILGHQNFAAPPEVRAAAYRRMVTAAAEGAMRVDHETLPLERAPEAWDRQARSPGVKLVLVPGA